MGSWEFSQAIRIIRFYYIFDGNLVILLRMIRFLLVSVISIMFLGIAKHDGNPDVPISNGTVGSKG